MGSKCKEESTQQNIVDFLGGVAIFAYKNELESEYFLMFFEAFFVLFNCFVNVKQGDKYGK